MLTGVAEKARSGRNDVTNEPIVGGESSEISWYALNTCCQDASFTVVASSPRGGRCCKLSGPAHLAQHLNIRDLSDMTEERVELCRMMQTKRRKREEVEGNFPVMTAAGKDRMRFRTALQTLVQPMKRMTVCAFDIHIVRPNDCAIIGSV